MTPRSESSSATGFDVIELPNDNCYSEAQFKTLKYRPGFPDRFGSIQDARSFCVSFFTWYNDDDRHQDRDDDPCDHA